MTHVVKLGRGLTLAALLVPGAAAVGQETVNPSRPDQNAQQGAHAFPSGTVTLPGATPTAGMMGGGETQMAATARHVYVLRGGRLYAFDSRSLQMTGTAELPGVGGREAVAGVRSGFGVPGASGRLGGRDADAGSGTPSDATRPTGGAGSGVGGAAGAERRGGATGRAGDAAAGNAAGAAGGEISGGNRGAAGAGTGREPGSGHIGGVLGHGTDGGSMGGSLWLANRDSIRLVATDRAVYVLNGEQLLAFEAGTLRRTGAATVPVGAVGTSRTGAGGAGSPSGSGTGTLNQR